MAIERVAKDSLERPTLKTPVFWVTEAALVAAAMAAPPLISNSPAAEKGDDKTMLYRR
jgi:hypothetical protein